ncbi:GNAT family N-acetyltransferase [Aeromonas cavernicola]|uniref:RimJ/RimL family protein N-acetyltransferase n=1 Tax=Aeromonas cavernicola TaxID=1006623 RepID=A0A2H9U6B0_9GAMM|nr:GNAT family protein [Aeromonas cavernicola]PJG59570.1 RimJ/RimL family protein N-acetyltransferase [Aeromonas cavernicola]
MFSWQLNDELALLFLQPDMASELFALCQNNREYLCQWLAWPTMIQQPADYVAFIRHAIEQFARGEGLTTAIEYQGELVGMISYNQIDQALSKVTMGYWLAERWQGHGIITRACQALIHHAFEEMGMEKVEISVAIDNEPSRAVCERLGMQQEGVTRRAGRLGARIVDHAHYSLLRDEWLRQRDP